jgi:hypothetical protein
MKKRFFRRGASANWHTLFVSLLFVAVGGGDVFSGERIVELFQGVRIEMP